MRSTVFVLSCTSILCVLSQGDITVRRDAEWPPASFLEPMSEITKLCRTKVVGVTDELIRRFSDKDVHDHPDLKCYLACIMIEFKTMDENGTLDASPAIDLIGKSEKWVQKILLDMGKKCIRLKYPKNIDLCEKAFILHKCMKEADPVHFFLV